MSLDFVLPFIRWADVSILTGRASVSQRRIYDHELVFVMSGSGKIQIENAFYTATPERLFLILPRDCHSFVPDADVELHVLGVHFDWTPQHDTLTFPIFSAASEPVEEKKFRERREVPGWNLQDQPFLELQRAPEIRRSLESVVTEYSHYDEYSQSAAGALLAAFFSQLQRTIPTLGDSAGSTPVGADAVRRVQRARELLESHQKKPLSIEEVAAHVQWSGDHLRRMTRAVLGTSPLELQRAARLRLARELLRNEDICIARIGERCGFDDASHFARVFKAQTGLTPRQYARMARRT